MRKPVDLHHLRPQRGLLRELVTSSLERRPMAAEVGFPAPSDVHTGTFTSGRGRDLAIDFGTSAIAAALVGGSFGVEILSFGDLPILPAPFGRGRDLGQSRLTDNYELSYGYLGGATAPTGPQEYYPCLKRRIEWLARCRPHADWRREAILDVAAVCQLALGMARDKRGRPLGECLAEGFQTYITVPNAFPSAAIDVLERGVAHGVAAALGRRQRSPVRALLEAEAVAYGAISKPHIGRGGRGDAPTTLLVVDAGAGTTDVSILRAEYGDLRVLAHVGLPVGGMDLDTFIASLKGPLGGPHPAEQVSHWLGTARETKEHHLGDPAALALSPSSSDPEAAFRRLAKGLVEGNDWPAHSTRHGDRPIAGEIARAHERYLALAVRSLIRALPEDEVERVDRVVVSGRASLLVGFQDAVRRTLAEYGRSVQPECDEDPTERKLAVVRGVAAYVASTYGAPLDRRPTRASFEIFLRHSGGRELPLLAAGHPLVQGWGVAAWHQPLQQIGNSQSRPRVEMRLVPKDVLEALAKEEVAGGAPWAQPGDKIFANADLDNLLRWSVLPVLRIDDRSPPYSARLAFDFLTLEAQLEIDGVPTPRLDRPEETFGRQHPVHQLDDNWFELSS